MLALSPVENAVGFSGLLSLIWLASPALPIGGFSYSEGLEAAVEAACIHDEQSAKQWLCDQLHLSLARADLPILSLSLSAWRDQDTRTLSNLNQWFRCSRETAELRLQSEQMGKSLVDWLISLRQYENILIQLPRDLRSPSYPVAYGLALALSTPPEQPPNYGLCAYAFGWAENMVQAAIKAVPLGQGAGQRILADLVQHIPLAVTEATKLTIEDLQAFTPMLAVLSARHETQYSRLFRS